MPPQNMLLSAMEREVYDRLVRHMTTVDLPNGRVLHRPGETIRDIYFPLDCLISVTVCMTDGRTAEVGMVGSRGMVGVNAFMGGRETNQTGYVAQIAGAAIRMAAEPLLEEFDRNKSLRDVMLRYTQAYIAQLSQNVACNRQHEVSQRLARWLLESRDRIQSDDLGLTHEFIGQMLGTSRPVISEALERLHERGLVRCGRGEIRLLDSRGLESASCECYGVIRDEYNRLLGAGRGAGTGEPSAAPSPSSIPVPGRRSPQ